MQWDRDIYAKFRELAVTDASTIEIGKTYYSNTSPLVFTVSEILTYREHSKRMEVPSSLDKDVLGWIVPVGNETDWLSHISLADRNVTQSYNPWMIFENEQDALDCREALNTTITFEPESWDDDDWGYWDDPIYEDDEQ